MSHFNQGDEVRITVDVPETGWDRHLSVGTLLVIEDYVTATEAEDGNAFYWANINGGYNNASFPEGSAELVRTAAQMAERQLPTRQQIRDGLGLLSGSDLDLNGTDNDGTHSLEVYGRTAEGLTYGFRLVVEEVWGTDE